MRRRHLLTITVSVVVTVLLVLSVIITTMRYTPRQHVEQRTMSAPGATDTPTPVQPPTRGTL
jgi:hypothetical protein